ncbi:transporter substrate-binding domain-containing protein [Colwellia sp. 1_MG-2023]|uniref:substrate-binding periplasmic protein n=1 Tax=Colwellia sp. 1_MG-2023 TaxID=3062649 RepID=UPI0026E258D1|nr:transporter substrate-binding domain-containing protein [Colwellia sp. 1_MG-2023]MDO6445433.1 transporter substrate-binding domain-containing protein [Colwellia sp. 1_MG-2023]
MYNPIMQMNWNILFLSLLILCSFSSSGNNATWIIYGENYPPYSYLSSGKAVGLAVDKVKQIFEDANIDYRIDIVPWARALHHANKDKNTAIFSIIKTKNNKEHFEWLSVTHDVDIYYWCYKECPRDSEIDKVNVAYTRHTVVADLMRMNERKKRMEFQLSSYKQAFEMLMKNRVKVVLHPESIYREFIKNNTNVDEKNIVRGPLFHRAPAYLALNRYSNRSQTQILRSTSIKLMLKEEKVN